MFETSLQDFVGLYPDALAIGTCHVPIGDSVSVVGLSPDDF
jgi:hypothetical protein